MFMLRFLLHALPYVETYQDSPWTPPLSLLESTDNVVMEAKDKVSVFCVADVTLELEIVSQSSNFFASDNNLLSLLSLLVSISCSSLNSMHK